MTIGRPYERLTSCCGAPVVEEARRPGDAEGLVCGACARLVRDWLVVRLEYTEARVVTCSGLDVPLAPPERGRRRA